MSMAIGDPEEILRFAAQLEHYLATLDEETGNVQAGFDSLGDSWRDEKRASFEQTFSELLGVLATFKKNASEQIPYLRTLAERLTNYIRT